MMKVGFLLQFGVWLMGMGSSNLGFLICFIGFDCREGAAEV